MDPVRYVEDWLRRKPRLFHGTFTIIHAAGAVAALGWFIVSVFAVRNHVLEFGGYREGDT